MLSTESGVLPQASNYSLSSALTSSEALSFFLPWQNQVVSPHSSFLKATLPVESIVCVLPSLFWARKCQIQFTLISEY